MDATNEFYGNVAAVAQALAYSGIGMIRDAAYDTSLAAFTTLAAGGTRFDLVVDAGPASEVATFVSLGTSVAYFEGPNEINIQPVPVPGKKGVAAALALQQELYAAVKASPVFHAVPVIDESLGGATPADYRKYSSTSAYSDFVNLHTYAADGDAPITSIPPTLAGMVPTTKPTIVTETGYYTLPQDSNWGGVSEAAQARYTLDTLLDDTAQGIPATFLYELYDEGPDPTGTNRENHFGLFDANGLPKLAATALHDLTTILADPAAVSGPALALASLKITGLPDTGNSLVLTKHSGLTDVVVWAEAPIWDPVAHTDIPAPPASVLVDLGQTVQTVRVYDPLAGIAPIAIYDNVSAVTVTVTDHPLIIEADPTKLTPDFVFNDAVAGLSGSVTGELYSGPVTYLQQQYFWTGTNGVAIASNVPNVFLHGGPGNDALQVSGGHNVLDGGGGSNFLVGATGADGGADTFFVDGRGGTPTWSTVVNFHHGDAVTLFGFVAGTSTQAWTASDGAPGFVGVTLHAELGGTGTGVNASLTLAGLSAADLQSKVTVSTDTIGGTPYLQLTYTG